MTSRAVPPGPPRARQARNSTTPDDDQLARLTEEERVAAGLDAYDPDEVPPATDTPPQPEDITLNEDWQEEQAEFRRQQDKGELRPIDRAPPVPAHPVRVTTGRGEVQG